MLHQRPIFRSTWSSNRNPKSVIPCKKRLLLVKDVGKVAAAAVLAVGHGSHEDTGTALSC